MAGMVLDTHASGLNHTAGGGKQQHPSSAPSVPAASSSDRLQTRTRTPRFTTALPPKYHVQRQKQRSACLGFLEAIIFMVGFLFLVWAHEDIDRVFELEHLMELTLTKQFGEHSLTFADVKDVTEAWKWVDLGLLPAIVKHADASGRLMPHQDWGFLAGYNRIIGGLRVSQRRGGSRTCRYTTMQELYSDCQPLTGADDTSSFGYPDCSDHDAVAQYEETHEIYDLDALPCFNASTYDRAVDLYNDEGFTLDSYSKRFEMWIDLFDDEDIIRKRLDYLKDRNWIDVQTKEITFALLVFNGQDEPLVTEAMLSLDFSRVGSVRPTIKIETVPISPYFSRSKLKIVLEVLFVGILFRFVVTKFKHIRSCKTRCASSSWREVLTENFLRGDAIVGNIVDLCVIGLGFLICFVWFQVVREMDVAEDGLAHLKRPGGVVEYDDTDHDKWSDYHHDVADVEHLVAEVLHSMVFMRRLAFFMVVLIIVLMFKTWDDIPAMRGVQTTIINASSRLFSFGIIIMCLITLFAGGAMLAFGLQMEEFHTFSDSVVTTLIVLSTGSEGIYGVQFSIDPLLASLWHWSVVIIMYVVCLNLVLCILVDAYSESQAQRVEKEKEMHMPTLHEQCVDTALYCIESAYNMLLRSEPAAAPGAARSPRPLIGLISTYRIGVAEANTGDAKGAAGPEFSLDNGSNICEATFEEIEIISPANAEDAA